MRAWIVVIAVLAACKGGKDKDQTASPKAATAAFATPKVAVATVLAKDDGKPPYLLLVDDAGTVRLGAAKTWADFDANQLKIAKKAGKLAVVDRFVREEYGLERDPLEAIASWDEVGDADIDLSDLDDTTTRDPRAHDDPPPPEDEDKPDDGQDESGGTGTAMALDEGKMGKKDADRAEGQYKMQKNQDDPQLARQQAIEQARAAGILGTPRAGSVLGSGAPNKDGTPARVAQVEGAFVKDGKLERLRAMIVIAPTAKAAKLIDAVRVTDAAIAVAHDGKIRPLNLQFGLRDSTSSSTYWLEARVSAKGIVVEAVPDKPLEVATLDQLGAAVEKARATRGADAGAPVDVLVDPDVDVQRLVDVIVALDTSNVKLVGMGGAPSAEELARRGHRIPMASFGQPNAQGDLDKAIIRRVVKSAKVKITYCYEKALLADPSLAGTVQVMFFIKPDGTVANASGSGVDPEVASCVAGVIKSLAFPKPKGGGGVQVNYPFTMRP